MFPQSFEDLSRTTSDSIVSPNYVIWTPQSLNRYPRLLIANKQTFIMVLQSCKKWWRKTFDSNVLKNMSFGLGVA